MLGPADGLATIAMMVIVVMVIVVMVVLGAFVTREVQKAVARKSGTHPGTTNGGCLRRAKLGAAIATTSPTERGVGEASRGEGDPNGNSSNAAEHDEKVLLLC